MVLTVVAVTLLAAREARAEDHERRWYGGQILAVYGVETVLSYAVVSGVKSPTPRALALSLLLGGTLFAAPAVHVAHNRWHAAEESLGLTLGLSTLGGLLGESACYSGRGHHPFELFCVVIGAELGWVTALTIDVASLAYEDVPVAPTAQQRATARRGRRLVVPPVHLAFRF